MKPLGAPMLEITVIDEGDALRDFAEKFIRHFHATEPLTTGVSGAF